MRPVALLLALPFLSSAAFAQDSGSPSGLVDQLLGCRSLASSEERLSCFERTTDALRSAVAEERIVVAETKALREARREQFGLSGNSSPNQPNSAGAVAKLKEVDAQVASARLDPQGNWLLALADGAVWRQIGGKRPIFDPKPGSRVVIREGTLGTYSATIDGQRTIKVRRER